MRILALDSCGAACAVGVWDQECQRAFQVETMQRGQDARLIPMTLEVMQNAGLGFDELDRIAVTRGPGSFTGARVGLAAAMGLGLAAQRPVLGIDRFAAFHRLYGRREHDLLVVIESKRAELFCQFFGKNGEPHAPELMTRETIDAFVKAHEGLEVVGDEFAAPSSDLLAACAQIASDADPSDPAYLPRPLYLRAPDVTVNSR